MVKRKALGKGLENLFPDIDLGEGKHIQSVKIEEIVPSPFQPRDLFDETKIEELAKSIKEKGILAPLVVRPKGEHYEIVVGERRWRAAQKAGIYEVPIIIKEFTDQEVIEVGLVENLQRENLSPLEEANAYQKLTEEFGFTQDEIAKKIGKDRSSIANSLRLLKLSNKAKRYLSEGVITAGHARAILSIDDPLKQDELLKRIIKGNLSVRAAEKLAKKLQKEKTHTSKKNLDKTLIAQIEKIENDFKNILGTKVNIHMSGKKGKIEIHFFSIDDLNRIIDIIKSSF
ncbi:MAG: hypothetical protein DRG20_01565 [Deltaproteobacteria bacterium]|nr:MAG: hypothetical protein DRG20_01565 [Deltaproteobacteria bacterium]